MGTVPASTISRFVVLFEALGEESFGARRRIATAPARFDPFLATLRDDPRFLGLFDRMRRESNREL